MIETRSTATPGAREPRARRVNPGGTVLLGACLCAILSPAPPVLADDGMAFDLRIVLSAKAAAKLEAEREGIIVLASYYGDPTPAAEPHANEIGMIDLAAETIEVAGASGTAHVNGRGIPAERLSRIEGPARVNVNVVSARKSSDDNVLSCDIIDADVSEVARAPVTLSCSLIEEGVATLSRP